MQKLLIFLGVALLMIGIFWPWISQIPFGRLPGDIIIERPGFKFYFPITTMLIVSIVVTLILWFINGGDD
ncbi:MAG: DUF2905 domain-containing protein [Gammaproteobacteria bacterium]|nr:MAG: DUF2905 domain-containing protein [Gammaproteobacteria bacterium]